MSITNRYSIDFSILCLYFSLLKGLSSYRRISFTDFWESVIILLRR